MSQKTVEKNYPYALTITRVPKEDPRFCKVGTLKATAMFLRNGAPCMIVLPCGNIEGMEQLLPAKKTSALASSELPPVCICNTISGSVWYVPGDDIVEPIEAELRVLVEED